MNKNINDRIEYLRDVLIAMINEHTGSGIPEEELVGDDLVKIQDADEMGIEDLDNL